MGTSGTHERTTRLPAALETFLARHHGRIPAGADADIVELRALAPGTGTVVVQQFATDWRQQGRDAVRLRGSANVYGGVNPRQDKHGGRAGVRAMRFIVLDADDKTFGGHEQAWAALTSLPFTFFSLVDTGGGFHGYLALDQDYGPPDFARIEGLGRRLSRLV